MTNEMKVWHWTDVLVLKNRIHKMMLLKEGVVFEVKCLLKGESPRVTPQQVRMVRFDRSYVVHKLTETIKPISGASKELLAELLQEALFALVNQNDEPDKMDNNVLDGDDTLND